MPVYESEIEKKIWKRAEARGWWQCKFVSPGKKAVPDRLFIKAGRHVFLEVKVPGEEPTRQQAKRHDEMREHGAEVYWVVSVEEADVILT